MSVRRIKQWRKQPQVSTLLDNGSSLRRGLLFHAPLHPQWGMRDLVSGAAATKTGLLTNGSNDYGLMPVFGTSNYADFTVPPTLDGALPCTIAWVQEPRSTTGFSTILNIRPALNAGNAFLIYEAASNSAYSLAVGNRSGGSVVANFDSTVGAVTNGRLDFYVVTVSGGMNDVSGTLGNFVLWRNGVKLAPGGLTQFGANTTASFRIGALETAGDPFEGLIGGVTIWQRVLNDAEAFLMSTRPSAIYAPLLGRVAMGFASAAAPKFRSRSIYGTRAGSRSAG